jgi:phosphatidylethanolamine/phosphatidyl-N-methylethanolamine N-methyltransferase
VESQARAGGPDGRVLLLDCHLSRKPGVRLWMRCLSPWLNWVFAARLDATTERHVGAAGLEPALRRSFMGDGVTMLVLKPAEGRAASRSAA